MEKGLFDYASRWGGESELANEFAQLLRVDGADPFTRERLEGHFTGSAWVVSQDKEHVLLTHHRGLDRWLQLGGHADGERDLAAVALREAKEESGIDDLILASNPIFDIDKHWIPDSRRAPGHWHYDVRYVVLTAGTEEFVVSDESFDLMWRRISDVASDVSCDASLRRMASKWQRIAVRPVGGGAAS